MIRKFSFERLAVWEEAIALLVLTYQLTEKFPRAEKFGLSSQIRRAVLSISSNIAEGSGRKAPKEQARFYEIAYSSLLEAINQGIASERLGYLTGEELVLFREKATLIAYKLNNLRHRALQKV